MYDEKFAAVYDEIYLKHKDYSVEALRIRDLARQYVPSAASLLDVGCGTGAHLGYLSKEFVTVGIDNSAPMVEAARRKLSDVPIYLADMCDFDLGRTFDVICCMYSAVGYLPGIDEYFAAIRNMVAHLNPGGVVIVEPWILRERWNGGDLVATSFEGEDCVVSRMGKWCTRSGRSYVAMNYLIGDASGVRHFVDEQELALFSQAEYEAAFEAAGCTVDFLPEGYADRGVFVGQRPLPKS